LASTAQNPACSASASSSADPSRDPLSTITISRPGQFTILRSDHSNNPVSSRVL
jgi:hypothetical protein